MAAWQLVGSKSQPCFAGQAVQAMGAVHLQRANRSRRPCTVVAYSVRDNIHDWRVKQMVDIANSYFQNLWSQVAIFSTAAVHCVVVCCRVYFEGHCGTFIHSLCDVAYIWSVFPS